MQNRILSSCRAWVKPSSYVHAERPCSHKIGLSSSHGIVLCINHRLQLQRTGRVYLGPRPR